MRARVWRDAGQGIVEFAVIFPLFIMLIFIMIDGGLLMGHFSRVHHAVDEGARFAATGASEGEIIERISDQSGGLIDENEARVCPSDGAEEICVQWYPGPGGIGRGEVGSFVKISVHYHYELFTPFGGIAAATGFLCGNNPPHFCVDPCTIVTLERPVDAADIDPENRGSGTPSCDNPRT